MAHVTIPDQASYVTYSSQTGTGPYAVPFAIFEKADITVEVGGVAISQAAFSYTPTSSTTGGYQTGTITLSTAAAAQDVTIYRRINPKRTSDMAPGPQNRDALNSALDRVHAQLQDNFRDLDRALKLPLGEIPSDELLTALDTVADIAPQIENVSSIDAELVIVADAMADVETVADAINSGGIDTVVAIGGLTSAGVVAVDGLGAATARSIQGTSNEISVAFGNGDGGNPTISLPSALTLTGKTVTGGTFADPTLSGTVAGSPTMSGDYTFTGLNGVKLETISPVFKLYETDAAVDEKEWRFATSGGDFFIIPRNDANTASGTTPFKITRTGTVSDTIVLTATTVIVSGILTSTTAATTYKIGNWSSSNTDIDGLISGTAFGALYEGQSSGHLTLGIRGNDTNDGFQVISGYDGVNHYTTDNLYKRLCFEIKSTGNAYINGTLDLGHASANTLSASSGILSIEGVAIPTISSADTLSNKTLSSPTLSGTVAGSPTASGSWTFSNVIVGVTPTLSTHLATKGYVDSVAVGLQPKDAVALATTANITLSGEQTIDGTLTSASRVLVKNQTTQSQNGIYTTAAGAWARTTDMDVWTETLGALVPVTGGTTNGNKVFVSTAVSGGTIGSTSFGFTALITTAGLQPLDSDLTDIAALTTTSFGRGLLTESSASTLRTTAGLVIGTDVQAYSSVLANTTASFTSALESKLNGIEAAADVTDAANVDAAGAVMDGDFSANGVMARTAAGTYASRTITGSTGLTVTNGDGVSGNPTLTLDPQVVDIAGLTPTDNGVIIGDGTNFVVESGATLKTSLGLTIGTDVQAYDADLAALAANSTDGFWAHTGAGTGAARTLTAPAAGLTITNPAGIAGNPTFGLANDLSALEGLASTGFAVRSASDTWVQRSVAGTTNEISVANGDGVSGNPTISLPASITLTGKTLTGGTLSSPTLSGTVAGSPTLSGTVTITNGVNFGSVGSKVREYSSADTQITALVAGSSFGAMIEGPSAGHVVIGVRDNDTGDGLHIISGNGNYTTDTTYDKRAASIYGNGNAYLAGTLDLGATADTTISRKSAGILQVEAIQLATVGPRIYRTSQYCVGDGSTDDYTAFNALNTTAAAASAVIIVDGLIRLGSNTTVTVPLIVEGGGFTVDSTKVLEITGTVAAPPMKIFQGSGTVKWNAVNSEVYPEWWGVNNSGTSANNLSSVNAMHAAITAGDRGAVIKWATKAYTFSGAWTTITKNNIRHVGAGGASLGTWFIFENTTGNDITFADSQHCSVQYISFIYYAKKTSGYAVKFDSMSWSFIHNCTVYYGYNGFEIEDSTECVAVDCQFRYLAGTYGVHYTGTVGNGSYRLTIRNLMAATPPPIGSINNVAKVKGNWATSTAYTQEDVVVANSKIWMCTTSGTSSGAGSGPSTLPGSTASEQWSTEVTDGTAGWKFMWRSDLTWLAQDNYAYSLAVDRAALVYGAYGFQMLDTAATGSSYPIWALLHGVETDHCHWDGINLERGEGAYLANGWHGSTLAGHGVRSGTSFRGEVTVTASRIMGNSNNGILIQSPGWIVTNNHIGDNSVASANTYSGVVVAAGVSDLLITNNRIGDLVGVSGNNQKYGVEVAVGASDNYIITQNVMRGNTTSGLSDGGTGANKTVSGNIV